MLCKLSFKNIKKSLKDYAIYFFTLVLGISIFYLFNSIDSQTAMMNLSESTSSIIELMTRMMSVVSVFVSFILGFLVIYASRFLIKRRNKECKTGIDRIVAPLLDKEGVVIAHKTGSGCVNENGILAAQNVVCIHVAWDHAIKIY